MHKSPFDLSQQNRSDDALIVAALERIAQSFRVLLWDHAKVSGLSPLQVQALLFVNYHDPEKANVSYLAKEFNVTKATMSDTIRVLTEKGMVKRIAHETDSRSHLLALTAKGKKLAQEASGFASSLTQHISTLPSEQKTVVKDALMTLIYNLVREGTITVQRMCYTCTHFSSGKNGPFCNLLKIPLPVENRRIDCPEHDPVAEYNR